MHQLHTWNCHFSYYFKTTPVHTGTWDSLPTYWKTPRRRSQASWRSQIRRQTVPGFSPCMGYQKRTRSMRMMKMKSGGNCAPIDRQRSWSHSWMAVSAGWGKRRRVRGRDEGGGERWWLLWETSKGLNVRNETQSSSDLLSFLFISFFFLFLSGEVAAPLSGSLSHPYILQGPMHGGEVGTCVTAQWERLMFYICHETHGSDGGKGLWSEKFWALKGPEVKSRGERGFDRES